MDESTLTALEDSAVAYRCPGETHPISHAVHVARLATFYPACRNCEHRHDTGVLSQQQVQRLAELEGRPGSDSLVTTEGLAGVVGNQLTAPDVHHFAAAFGLSLFRQRRLLEPVPGVVLGGDGRALTAELVAAASEGLRIAGCSVIELGGATAGLLTWAVRHLNAAGGLLVGNERGEPHTASVKLWGAGARPWSAGDSLDPVVGLFRQPLIRPTRRFAALERFSGDDQYLARLRELYHALRPLRFVLDTSSRPLLRHLQQLLKTSACRIIAPRLPEARNTKHQIPKTHKTLPNGDWPRIANLAEQVRSDGADFGVWIDGDGQSLHVADERGRVVPAERFVTALAQHPVSGQNGVLLTAATRESMHQALETSGAALGGRPSGRFWINDGAPQLDALLVLSLLLAMLSQSDRPLSTVLDVNERSK